MKTLKLLLTGLLFTLLPACSGLEISSQNAFENQYYDYEQIEYYYINNPDFIFTQQYLNVNGNHVYYYRHPYFIRYQRDYYKNNGSLLRISDKNRHRMYDSKHRTRRTQNVYPHRHRDSRRIRDRDNYK